MKVNHTLVVYALAFAVGGMAYVQYLNNKDLSLIIRGLQSRPDSSLELGNRLDQLQGVVTQLRSEMATLQEQLADAQPATGSPTPGIATANPAPTPDGVQPATPTPFSAMRSFAEARFNSPEGRDLVAQTVVTSQYGEFINSLGLAPEDRQQLMDAMKGVVAGRFELQQRLRDGEISMSQYQAVMENGMRQELGKYLSSEELAVFDDFEADRPNRERRQMVDVQRIQLNTGAPGLTEDNKTLVAEAMATVLQNPNRSFVGSNAMEFNDNMNAQVEAALQGRMDESQMQILREFLQNRSKMIEAFQ